jgi:hypothetical protein
MKLSLVCGRALQVENCLTTKAVQSEQYIEEVKTMKAFMLQQCPHLARWGLGSNKVRSWSGQQAAVHVATSRLT